MKIKFEYHHVEVLTEDKKRGKYLVSVIQRINTSGATIYLKDFQENRDVPLSYTFNYLDEAREEMCNGFEVLPESETSARKLVLEGIATEIIE